MKNKKSQQRTESFYAIKWNAGILTLLDQRKLPNEVIYLDYASALDIADAIKKMVVRGAMAWVSGSGIGSFFFGGMGIGCFKNSGPLIQVDSSSCFTFIGRVPIYAGLYSVGICCHWSADETVQIRSRLAVTYHGYLSVLLLIHDKTS